MNEQNNIQLLHEFNLITKFNGKIEEGMPSSLLFYLKKYLQQTWGDLYKFIYQGSCGWIHLKKISNLERVKVYLEQRVWKEELGLSSSYIWKLMEESLRATPQTLLIFIDSWNQICYFFKEGILTTEDNQIRLLKNTLSDISIQLKGYKSCLDLPLISHSAIFRTKYKPSYRIVSKLVLDNFLKNYE
ncbi:MAG: hypothetical protein ACTSQ6_11570 [Candidatus Heimdallarchaeaceae archaeon]